MDILKKIFGLSKVNGDAQPAVVFGRYTDAYKDKEKYDAWDAAMREFDQENFTPYFEKFFYYLGDDEKQNVKTSTTEGITYFEIFQGSKLLVGTADRQNIRVESKIAKSDNLNIGLLRRLLELNFSLKYCRYALDKNDWVTMIFEAKTSDTNPYKLYYGLKELALNSDKQDDILESEFKSLTGVNKAHIVDLEEAEKRTKYDYFQQTIRQVLETKESINLNLDSYPGAISYLCLDVIYRLDYLLKPEGHTMESFEKMHRNFYAKNGESPARKNVNLLEVLDDLKDRSYEDLAVELYNVTSTFGITQPSGHERMVEFIQKEIQNIHFYESNGYNAIVQSIYNYIVGYCLFNYSLPTPDKSLLHLYYLVNEHHYFKDLGFTYELVEEGVLNRGNIVAEIKNVARSYKEEYGEIIPDIDILNFTSLQAFSKSYLVMLSRLKLSPSKNLKKS